MQSNTVQTENQPVDFVNFSVENRKADPFTIVDGRYVGHDEFVVPKNFDEFHERFPQYVRDWVNTHVDRSVTREDREDWTQDLLIHLRYLPVISKHREAGKQDIVQTFDPHKHHGANAARFFNYINVCLGNKLGSIRSKRIKNPICRTGNVSLGGHFDESDSGQVDDEFCHAHSAYLRRRCQRREIQRDASHTLAEFAEFAQREDSNLFSAICAIATTSTPGAAAELLGITKADLRHLHNRLRKLGQLFLAGGARQRRSSRPKALYSHHCEVGANHAVHSRTAWNRVDLYNEVWNQPLIKLSRKYGISDVRLGMVCRELKIPHPGRGYWAKRKAGKPVVQPPLTVFEDAPIVRRFFHAEFRYNWGSTERRE
jgi:hypothetical protein